MFAEKRHEKIMDRLKDKGVVKVSELVEELSTSEATIRRDLAALEEMNHLRRVHGGAVPVQNKMLEKSYNDKAKQNMSEKDRLAKFAAGLINDGDSIYLDSGTTVYEMIKYVGQKDILVVTNGISHVEALIQHNIPAILLGGKVKPKTKALIGSMAMESLKNYHFDKCFMGTNGIDANHGLTTPDPEEGALKNLAITLSKEAFVLADEMKVGEISFMKFADVNEATLITNAKDNLDVYEQKTIVKVVAP